MTLRTLAFAIPRSFGAVVAALGVTGMVWEISGHNARGYFSSSTCFLAAIAALACALLLRLPAFRRAPWAVALRGSSEHAALLLALAALAANGVDTRAASQIAAMRSDLRRVVELELNAQRDSGHYASHVGGDWRSSTSVTTPAVVLTNDGWTAEVRHTFIPNRCAIFEGTQAISPAVREREPACTVSPMNRAALSISAGLMALGRTLATMSAGATVRV